MLCLIDNGYFVDAFMVGGHIIETFAVFSYIMEGSPSNASERFAKYSLKSSLTEIKTLLEFDESNLETNGFRKYYLEYLEEIEKYGHLSIKNGVDNKDVVEYLKYTNRTNKQLLKKINESYSPLGIESMLRIFFEKFPLEQVGMYRNFYNKYCAIKHSSLYSAEINAANNSIETLLLLLYSMYNIFYHIDKYTKELTPVQ